MYSPVLNGPWPPGTDPRRVDAYLSMFALPAEQATHRRLAKLLVGRPGWAVGLDDAHGRIEWLLDPQLNRDASISVSVVPDNPGMVEVYRPDFPLLAEDEQMPVLTPEQLTEWLARHEDDYRHGRGWLRAGSWRLVRTAVLHGYGDSAQVSTAPDDADPASGLIAVDSDDLRLLVTYGRRRMIREGIWTGVELCSQMPRNDARAEAHTRAVFAALSVMDLPKQLPRPITVRTEVDEALQASVRVENDSVLSDRATALGLSRVFRVSALIG